MDSHFFQPLCRFFRCLSTDFLIAGKIQPDIPLRLPAFRKQCIKCRQQRTLRPLHILCSAPPDASVYNCAGKRRIFPCCLTCRHNVHMPGKQHRKLFPRSRSFNPQKHCLADQRPLRLSEQVCKLLLQILLISPDLIERLVSCSAHGRDLYHSRKTPGNFFKHNFRPPAPYFYFHNRQSDTCTDTIVVVTVWQPYRQSHNRACPGNP